MLPQKVGVAEWDNEFDSTAMVGEDDRPIIFRSRALLTLGEDKYIVRPVVACECDENSNEVSLNFGSLLPACTYHREKLAALNIDGEDGRLLGHIEVRDVLPEKVHC